MFLDPHPTIRAARRLEKSELNEHRHRQDRTGQDYTIGCSYVEYNGRSALCRLVAADPI